MTPASLLSHLESLGVHLRLQGDKLLLNAPKGAISPELKETLARLKPELMDLLRSRTASTADDSPPITRAALDGPMPLSFAQERIWFLEQIDRADGVYNIPVAARVTGPLDVDLLERCIGQIIARHAVLRTGFHSQQGRPAATVRAACGFRLARTNIADLPAEQRRTEMARASQDEAVQPFDLANDLLLRGRVLRIGINEHLLLLTFHHTVCDGWSLGVFLQELAQLYKSGRAESHSPLAELSIQYPDYARWQRERLSGEKLQAELDHWHKTLDGATPSLDLPTDRQRPASQTFAGAVHRVEWDSELVAATERLARDEGCTLFMVLLAAFSAVLGRYSQQQDLVIGTPIAGRTRAEFEQLIGLFVNTLALRVDLSDRPTFRELLRRSRRVALDAYAHQDVPFEKLVEALQPKRDLSRSPLFQVMLIVQNAPVPELRLGEATLTPLPDAGQTAKFDLTLELEHRDGRTLASWNYNRDLFEPAAIKRLAGSFDAFLRAALARPDQCIDSFALLSAAEREAIVHSLNRTHRPYETGVCVHELIERTVDTSPDAAAVVFEEQSITYAELESRSNRLARHLQTQGVRPDTLVGVSLERSVELVVALLGILKAGGAYVPFDPSYPAARLEYMVRDSGVKLVLTGSGDSWLDGMGSVQRIDVNNAIARQPDASRVHSGTSPRNLAYMIYTSGSTGQPKGAMNEHAGIVNRLQWMQEQYDLRPDDRVLQKTPFGFDVSVWEFFWPLMTGAALVVARPGGHRDPKYLNDLVGRERITTLHFVPSMLDVFLEEATGQACATLRRVICSGEALSYELKERFFDRLACELHNLYGPTEAAVDVTYWPCDRDAGSRVVPIGYPVANTRVHILDENFQPVPMGVRGEIYLGGIQVGRGYWGRPALTAERFIPDPFDANGGRLYRTGDAGRYREDGSIEYLGRLDNQVKIRGFRVELGEIEARLREHDAIREAAVVLAGTEQRLVAYIVRSADKSADVADLRSWLRDRLPDYMVPSAFVPLDKLPLSPNGKLDRKALPALKPVDADLLKSVRDHVPPRTPTEQILAGIWQDVLDVRQIGALDDFFESGGHSLLATQVVARIRDAFDVELPIHAVFEQPTLEGLARDIDAAVSRATPASLTAIVPIDRDGRTELPLSFGQQRLWFLEQLDPGTSLYNVPVSVRLDGTLDIDALTRAINHVIARHESLRTVFHAGDGEGAQRILPESTIEITVDDVSALPAETREDRIRERAEQEADRPFNLTDGPLIRASLLRVTSLEHVLLLTWHHIICDGWSVGVFLRETAEAYRAFRAGREPSLSPLPIQYADYAHWQRSSLTGETLATQIAYWRNRIGNNPPALNLPTDRPRPAEQTYAGATLNFEIAPATVAQLEAISRRENATLFMTLLTAFAALLARHSGQDDFVIGSPVAGRRDTRTEELIGFFVNTLPLRIELSGSPTFRDSLARVRQSTLQAYAHQDVPFEKLVDELQPQRHMSRPPVFQVVFAMQNMPVPVLNLDGLKLTPLPETATTAKFDLMLTVQPMSEGLTASLNYNRDLFDESTIRRMSERFLALLHEAAGNPEAPIHSLAIMPESERRLLVRWNETATDYPRAKSVHALFAEQAHARPHAIALEWHGQRLTYRELNERANAWACRLIDAGVKAETPVGVCAERSPEMIVALLAILKAGGAFVPLDPSFPADRLRFILSDTGTRIVLAQKRVSQALPDPGLTILHLDDAASPVPVDINSPVHPDGLAYVMYTSGSTGTPKGVAVTHRGIVRLVRNTNYAKFDSEQTFLQLAPLSFDASTLEIWGPLLNGSRLVIMPPGTPTPEELGRTLREHGVTTLWLTAGLFHRVVDHDVTLLDSVRQLLAGGDVLSVPHVQRVLERRPDGGVLINGYGPTECTTFTCSNPMRDPSEVGTSVAIGRPIANTRVYVLDRDMQQVPIGVAGELYVAGDGLARGYVNEPRLTAERFVPNPFADTPGERLYRTGDLVRWLPDGRIEFLGRLDNQVKIRGFRVEPGEVEAVLAEHPDLREAVVIARADVDSGKRLVAYVLPHAGRELTVTALRQFLQQRMPDYMVPSAFVFMDAFPLNNNGKVDRAALPEPESARPTLDVRFVAPSNRIETELARIWSEVLRLEQVGVDDNFFELGGDSILSLQVVSRAQRAGIRISTKQIFQHQTVAQLAAVAETNESTDECEGKETGEFPLLPAQRWFFEQNLPYPHHWNQCVLLKVRPSIDGKALEQAFRSVLARHDSLRLRFTHQNGEWIQSVSPADDKLDLERIDISAIASADLSTVVERHSARIQASLHLTDGPIIRMAWFDAGPSEPGRLLMVIHHLAIDGVSWRVVLEDFQSAYAQAIADVPIELPAPAVSPRRWARHLEAQARSESVKTEADYWVSVPDAAELPVDTVIGSNTEASARRVSVQLTAAQTESLLREVPRAYHTRIDEVLLAALARVLAQRTGRDRVCVDLEGHGREAFADDLDLSRTVGWLTSMYPVALNVADAAGPGDLLCSVKEQLRALPNRGAGYSLLRYLADEPIRAKLRAKACPQIRFNYLGQFDQVLAPSGDQSDSLILGPADESPGPEHSPHAPRSHQVEVNALIAGGRLRIDWVYSNELHRAETIEQWAGGYVESLCEIIRHCETTQSGGYTPSDFPLAGLDQDQLAKLANLLGGQS